MKPWYTRPFELRTLFNPGFSSLILLRSLEGYESIDVNGIPFSLSLLVLPLCLQKFSRNIILENPRRYLLKTIANHPEVMIDLDRRVNTFLGFTFEGLGFAMSVNGFQVTGEGRLRIEKKCKASMEGTPETIACQKAAVLLGKKFAQVNDRVTIYTALGLRP